MDSELKDRSAAISYQDELWMRIITFSLVGIHFCIITLLIIRFLKRACSYGTDHWQNHINESQRRVQRRDTPPPNFQAALKCPLPRPHSTVSIIEAPPPSYAEAIVKLQTQSPAPPTYSLQHNIEIHV